MKKSILLVALFLAAAALAGCTPHPGDIIDDVAQAAAATAQA